MKIALRLTRLRALTLLALPFVVVGATACLQPDGTLGAPGAPTQSDSASRLPSLLQQLQGSNGAGLEVFDGNQNQVLAAQDAQGKDAPTVTVTVTTTATPTSVSTVAGTKTAGPTARPEASTPTPRASTPTPTATATDTPTPTATSTPTPTDTPTPTVTPTPSPAGPPTEGTTEPPPHE